MSGSELKIYTLIQSRIIRSYQRHVHPELTVNEAAMMWSTKYSKMFLKWWKQSA